MKSRTEYVRPVFLEDLDTQVNTFKWVKTYTQKWIDLIIEYSCFKMNLAKRAKDKLS
jgi:hypothetical protein